MSTAAECKNMTVYKEGAAHMPTNQSKHNPISDVFVNVFGQKEITNVPSNKHC
jgi:hypothetical protein